MRITTSRDVNGAIRDLIDQELARTGTNYIAASLAVEIVERLQREDPELLSKWLAGQAVRIVREAIVTVERHHRMAARAASETLTGPQSVFGKALTQYAETGDSRVLSAWLQTTYVINSENQRKQLSSMDKDELGYAADKYQTLSRSTAMQAAFLRVIANKVGARTVGEVFTEEELVDAWRRLEM